MVRHIAARANYVSNINAPRRQFRFVYRVYRDSQVSRPARIVALAFVPRGAGFLSLPACATARILAPRRVGSAPKRRE